MDGVKGAPKDQDDGGKKKEIDKDQEMKEVSEVSE